MATRRLAAGEVLFELGDDGDEVYLVLEGEFDVVAPADGGDVVVGRLGPDDVAGEITAVVGGTRTATVRARTAAVVERYDGDGFDDWLASDPARADRMVAEARERVDRTRVARAVAELIGAEHTELIEAMTDAVEWVTIDSGTYLFRQGDVADAAYILVGGQMRVIATEGGSTTGNDGNAAANGATGNASNGAGNGATASNGAGNGATGNGVGARETVGGAGSGRITLDTRIGRGDLIGEMGVIEQAPRNASALAIRDCTLARIPKTEFERLTAAYPALMLPMARRVISRFTDRSRLKPHAGTIAVLVTAPRADAGLVEVVADEVARHGSTLLLTHERLAHFLNRRDIANAKPGSIAEARLTDFLHEVDTAHRWVIFGCDDPDSDWARRALRSADRVAIVCSAQPSSDERRAIAKAREVVEATSDYDLWLAPLHPAGTLRVRGTAALLDLSGASRAVHLRDGDDGTARRLARLLSGTGLGLALSGGGARSYGQIGALQACGELGIEIDAVAGTSMGSVIGGFTAMVDDLDHTLASGDRELDGADLLDYTLPLASIFSAAKITSSLERVFGSTQIEDTIIPFVCCSTNLSKSELVQHRRGGLVHAVRASTSLPGVFPPVTMGEDLLVDGGVLENLPIRPLREDPGISTIIAIDVAPPEGPRVKSELGLALSGTEVIRRRLRRDRFRYPPLAHTVISSMLVGSAQSRTAAIENDDIDLHVSLNLSGIKLLDFDKYREAVDRGYRDSLPALTEWFAGWGRNGTGQ